MPSDFDSLHRRARRRTSLCAVLLILLSAAPAAAATLAVTGWILPPGAAATVRVELDLLCRTGTEALPPAVRAAADGSFRLDLPAEGTSLIHISAEGYLPVVRAFHPEMETGPLPIARLQPARQLELIAVAPDGRPLPGIPLSANKNAEPDPQDRSARGWELAERRAVTGADGRALVPQGEGEDLAVWILAPRLFSRHEIPAGAPARLVLAPGRPATLVVRDAAGQPFAGARIGLWEPEEPDLELGRSGPDGRFEMTLQAVHGRSRWRVQGPAGERADLTLAAEPEPVVSLLLSPPPSAAGRVLDAATRQPIAGARVDDGCAARAVTAADGTFRLAGTYARGVLLTVRHDDYVTGSTVADGAEPVEFLLKRGTAAYGWLRSAAGDPVVDGTVTLEPLDPEIVSAWSSKREPWPRAGSGPDGRFQLHRLAPGRYQLQARAPGHAETLPREVTVAAGAAGSDLGVIVLGPTAELAGRVVDSAGRPVATAEVWVVRTAPRAWVPSTSLMALTQPDGSFRVADLAAEADHLGVWVNHPDYLPAEVEVTAPSARPLEIRLRRAGTLVGRVVGPRGEPVHVATLSSVKQVAGANGEPAWKKSGDFAATNVRGRFELFDLEPGPLTLQIEAGG